MSNFDNVVSALKNKLADADVQIIDLGGGNHLRVEVVSSHFEGKSLLEQHKMIHDILDDQMESNNGFIHALSIKTTKK